MKRLIPHLIVLVAVALLGGCESDIFNEEIPAFPQFKASASWIDFGRIEVRTSAQRDIIFSNRGGDGSILHLYYYLEGDPAFQLVTPEQEVALRPIDQALTVAVAFSPERGGEAVGNLVVYTSDRPLKEDMNVTTYRVGLRGSGGKGCKLPGPPAHPIPPTTKKGSSE